MKVKEFLSIINFDNVNDIGVNIAHKYYNLKEEKDKLIEEFGDERIVGIMIIEGLSIITPKYTCETTLDITIKGEFNSDECLESLNNVNDIFDKIIAQLPPNLIEEVKMKLNKERE